MLGLYGGFTLVCFGTLTMDSVEGLPKVSLQDLSSVSSVNCTIFVSILYFLVYLGLCIVKTANLWKRISSSKEEY